MTGEAQGGQLPLAGVARQQHMEGIYFKIKDGWRIGSSCRIGLLGEVTGMGLFPNMASIVGRSAGDSWINGCSQEGGSSTKVCQGGHEDQVY
jgi:hypothetical protein